MAESTARLLGLALQQPEFTRLRRFIQQAAGIHLSERKRSLVQSRLAPRLRELGYRSFADYCELLNADEAERVEVINRVTTHKTSFFREQHHFSTLAGRMAAARPGRIRIWSAGCSTGEEAYSAAITVREAVPRAADVRILASDIDTGVVEEAQQGVYPLAAIEGLSDDQRRRHFLRGTGAQEGMAQVRDDLRAMVAFRYLNLHDAQWPVRCTFDAIFCRNVLIYFAPDLQNRVVERLMGYLRPGGLLFLGHSEGLLGMRPGLRSLAHTAFERTP